jgi:hypothetical protein
VLERENVKTKGIARYQSKREETGHLVHCTSPMWVLERDIVYRSVQEVARSYTIVSIAPLCDGALLGSGFDASFNYSYILTCYDSMNKDKRLVPIKVIWGNCFEIIYYK